MDAILSFSDVHLSKSENRLATYAPSYYDSASTAISMSLNSTTNDNLDDRILKQLFAAIFFLIYVELLSPLQHNSDRYAAHFHLRSAYVLLDKFKERVSTWRGVSRRILNWIQLLDAKATFAGRQGALLERPTDIPGSNPEVETANEENEGNSSSAAELMWNAINQPAFVFFMKAQQFGRRIARIDRWHRRRGSLEDEYEVLQIAHKIEADMESLWRDRPAVLDIYDKCEELKGILNPRTARQTVKAFRQYVAGFEAQFIYLYRVAYNAYPRTARVERAMKTILRLAKMEVEEGNEEPLPLSLLWPLFMLGVEADPEERGWVMSQMRRMAGDNPLEQPSASRTLRLLEEITRRQDESNQRVDSRAVRRELFAVDFDMM